MDIAPGFSSGETRKQRLGLLITPFNPDRVDCSAYKARLRPIRSNPPFLAYCGGGGPPSLTEHSAFFAMFRQAGNETTRIHHDAT